MAAVILVIIAVYQMISRLAKGMPIISWLRKRKDQILLLEDILLNAIQRNDVLLTREALRVALRGQTDNHQAILDWLQDHRTWLSTIWLARELIGIILSSPLDAKAAKTYDDLLCTMLAEALEKEEFSHARFVLDAFCDALREAEPWTDAHANLLCHIGFTLWKIGEHGASAPRTARIPGQLEELRGLFVSQVRKTWYHVLHLKSNDAVDYFTTALCQLTVEATDTKEHCETLLSRVYDVLADGYQERLLEAQTIHELICLLTHLRLELPVAENEDTQIVIGDMQTEIDEYVLASLAILVELGEKKDALYRAAGNSYIWHRITRGKWLGRPKLVSEPIYYHWLPLSSYNTALEMLGLPGLSKKQVRKLMRLKAGANAETITIELEADPDETSQLLSGSSPMTPMSVKVYHTDSTDQANSSNGSSTATLPISADQR